MEKLLRKIVDQLREDGKAFAHLEGGRRLSSLGGSTVLVKVIDEQRKDLIIELDEFIRYCNYRRHDTKRYKTTHPGNLRFGGRIMYESKVDDEGQRYEVSASNPNGSKIVIGWSDTDEGTKNLVKGVGLQPGMYAPVIRDRYVLTIKAKKKLVDLIRASLIEMLNSSSIQLECYEQIYEDFCAEHPGPPGADQMIHPEYEKSLSTYLDLHWECWKRLLTEVVQIGVKS